MTHMISNRLRTVTSHSTVKIIYGKVCYLINESKCCKLCPFVLSCTLVCAQLVYVLIIK